MRTAILVGIGLAGLFFASRARAELPTSSNSTGGEPPVTPTGIPQDPQLAADAKGPAFAWSQVRYFKPGEFRGATFPGGPARDLLPLLDTRVILAADELRAYLGKPLQVSHVDGAIARTYGDPSSRHYAIGRLSDALDLFTPQASLDEVFQVAQQIPSIGGIGLYPHTKPYPLVHIDTRPRGFGGRQATWARDSSDKYVAIAYALNRSVA